MHSKINITGYVAGHIIYFLFTYLGLCPPPPTETNKKAEAKNAHLVLTGSFEASVFMPTAPPRGCFMKIHLVKLTSLSPDI